MSVFAEGRSVAPLHERQIKKNKQTKKHGNTTNWMWRKSSYELPVKWRILILCCNGSIFLTAGIKKVAFWNQSRKPRYRNRLFFFFF